MVMEAIIVLIILIIFFLLLCFHMETVYNFFLEDLKHFNDSLVKIFGYNLKDIDNKKEWIKKGRGYLLLLTILIAVIFVLTFIFV